MPILSLAAELQRISYFKAPRDTAVIPFAIPAKTIVIELVTEGVVHFRTEEADRTLGCGALFWHVAGEETIFRTESEAPYECLGLSFTTPARYARPVPRLSVIDDHQRVRELCRELLRAYHDPAINRDMLGAYAYSRLRWEAHLCAIQKSADLHPAGVNEAVAFVENHFRRPGIGLVDLARAASLSVAHLHALFRVYLGQTPHQFLTDRRIREAKWLLTISHTTIKAIATDCGFLNIETFYRAFRRIVGTSPHHFRMNHSASVLAKISKN